MDGDDWETSQDMSLDPSAPIRLALQSGRLDDHRRDITQVDEIWERAYRRYRDRDRLDDHEAHDGDARTLCELWPAGERRTAHAEALAVTVALAAPFASRDRILGALAPSTVPAGTLERELAHAPPVLSGPGASPRPRFPYVYDPDTEARAPIVAIVDGPRSPKVGEFLDTVKEQDQSLADAIVLGAELEMLELLDRLCLDAQRAARVELAEHFEQDRRRWRERADSVRSRQRLEGSHYGWHSDNLPPGCLEAAEAEVPSDVRALLDRLPPTTG